MTDTLSNPITDIARLAEVGRLCLHRGSDPVLSRFAAEAARQLSAPSALLGAVLNDTEVFLATHGLAEPYARIDGVPLDWTFCQYAVLLGAPLVVRDAQAEQPYRDLVAVTGLGARSYAGAPLVSSRGHTVGVLCVLDTRVRDFTDEQVRALTALGRQAVRALELDRRS
jgi:GAF domain-containing protein